MSGALAMLMLVLRLVVVPDAGVGESELERDLEICTPFCNGPFFCRR